MSLDVSDVEAFTERVLDEFADMPKNVLGFVEFGAEALQQTDPYQNHTHDLRTSTQAVNVDDDVDHWHFDLEMGMFYASYVNDRGFSRIDDIAEIVTDEIAVFVAVTMPRRILGGF